MRASQARAACLCPRSHRSPRGIRRSKQPRGVCSTPSAASARSLPTPSRPARCPHAMLPSRSAFRKPGTWRGRTLHIPRSSCPCDTLAPDESQRTDRSRAKGPLYCSLLCSTGRAWRPRSTGRAWPHVLTLKCAARRDSRSRRSPLRFGRRMARRRRHCPPWAANSCTCPCPCCVELLSDNSSGNATRQRAQPSKQV